MARKKLEYPGTVKEEKLDDSQCPWDQHGHRCLRTGSMSEKNNGKGPWWCSEHFFRRDELPKKLREPF